MNQRIVKFIGSRWFFGIAVGLFGLYALKIALTSQFPLPFDENYHFTLINYYSHHISPFITSQPDELGVTGDATRLGSYLSHYLMSYPLRVVSLFTQDQAVQIIALRVINIGFVIAALYAFRRLLVRFTKTDWIANLSVLVYCLLPVTSFLAAHINYDNPMLLCVALLFLAAQSIHTRIEKRQAITISRIGLLLTIALAGSLVKFTFLPIAAVTLLAVTIWLVRYRFWTSFSRKQLSLGAVAVLLGSLLFTGLFIERYGVNLAVYHSVQPDCAQVQSVNTCLQYGPWARNHDLAIAAPTDDLFEGRSFPGYVINLWTPMMVRGLNFTGQEMRVYDPASSIDYTVGIGAALLVIGAMLGLLKYRKSRMVQLFIGIVIVYFVVLIQRNFSEFMSLHALVAVQGRYALPFLIPLTAVGIMGILLSTGMLRSLISSALASVSIAGSMDPSEVYARTMRYWAGKFRRSDPADS